MATFTIAESREIYGAAYDGFGRNWQRGFEVALWSDGTAGPIGSGCSREAGGIAVFENVTESDFGQWDRTTTSREGFISMCLDCFGAVECAEAEG